MEKDFVCIEYFDDGVDEGMDGEWYSYGPATYHLSCGHSAYECEPNFCPECGKPVRKCGDCDCDWWEDECNR